MDKGSHELNAATGTLATDLTDTTVTELIAAKAGYRTHVDTIVVTNSHATVSTVVKLLNGTTSKFRTYIVAAGGGVAITLPTALKGASNTAWNIQCETTGSAIQAFVGGFYSKA
jgi:hypothetical protein